MHLQHHFLLATPQLRDDSFAQSLVYLVDHGEQGATGIVVNRPARMRLGDVFGELGIDCRDEAVRETSTYTGGPVSPQHGLVLHSGHLRFESTITISDKVALSSSADALTSIANGRTRAPWRVLFGHAGWAPGQLEREIADNAWLTCPADIEVLFHTDAEAQREAAGQLLGFDIRHMSGDFGHA